MDTSWRSFVDKLTQKVGKSEAMRMLVIEGLAPGTADKIAGNRYFSQPGCMVMDAIKRALEKAEAQAS